MRLTQTLGILLAGTVTCASGAAAQTFPADVEYVAGTCGGALSSDPVADQSGAAAHRDIVGDMTAPATFTHDDGTFLFLRVRVDDDPTQAGGFKPFGWAWAFDEDGVLDTFEVLVILDGIREEVRIERNTVTGTLGDPGDSTEELVTMYDASTHAEAAMAASSINGDPDWFVSVAAPRADLETAGLTPGARVIWAGTSSNGTTLNGDLACHDAGLGAPVLSDIPVDPSVVGTFVLVDTPVDGSTTAQIRPVISGTAEAGATVTIVIDGGAPVMVTAAADGTWSYTPAADLSDGSHDVVVTATSGGESAMVSITFTVDTMMSMDSDGDGLTDLEERPGDMDRDTDMDGTADHLDPDDDGDGLDTRSERPGDVDQDTDMDGTPNHLDSDDDGDTIPTSVERQDVAALGGDPDADGVPAWLDLDSDDDGVEDSVELLFDADMDGTPDYLDPDSAPEDTDGDGVVDAMECPGAMNCMDSDMDGVPDFMDEDDDGDGIPTATERVNEAALGQPADTDGVPAYLDLDSDDDGVDDATEGTGDDDMDGVPNYLDSDSVVPTGLDTDGDTVLDRDECPTGTDCPDTDGDGIPDIMDTDDDGDGIPTADERAMAADLGDDVDGDGVVNWLDADADGDGIADGREGVDDVDGDGVPDFLDSSTNLTGAGLSGGSCSAAASDRAGPLTFLGLLLLCLLGLGRRRRRAVASLGVALAIVGAGSVASAQVPLNRYVAGETPDDGFALSRPDTEGHLRWQGHLVFDYANDPLVYETMLGDSDTETTSIVEHHVSLRAGVGVSVIDRVLIFGSLPINVLQMGDELPGIPAAQGSTFGDLALGARVRLLGEQDEMFGLAAQGTLTLPSAELLHNGQAYSGDETPTFAPEVIAELRPSIVRVTANLGAIIRDSDDVQNLDVGPELTWGLGLTVPIIDDEDRLDAHAEIFGATGFSDFFGRETTPFEGLLGLKYFDHRGFVAGFAAGPGFARGWGTPDYRIVLSLGYSPGVEAPVEEEPQLIPVEGDSDGDGILDGVDDCPSEPEDVDTFEDENGCPDPDNDADGVLDGDDGAPLEPEDQDGYEDEDGVPDPDNDGDSIADGDDECPNEAEDVDTFEDSNGCPDPDNDQDTVPDTDDECPLAPGTPEANGCPRSVRVDSESGRILILERVEFATGRDRILPQSLPLLEEVRATLAANPQLTTIRVEGHTDDQGADAYNLDLSKRRAASVRRWLVEHELPAGRLEAYGCGETRPREPNTSREGRQANRRVEFHIVDPAPADVRSVEGCVNAVPAEAE